MIKNIIYIVVLFFCISQIYAFTCFNLITGQSYYGGGNSNVSIPLDTELVEDVVLNESVNEFADINQYFSCRNDGPSVYTDWFYLKGFTPALNPALSFGVQVNGVNYFDSAVVSATLPHGVLIQEFPRYAENSFPRLCCIKV